MKEALDNPAPRATRETILRVVVLSSIYAAAIGFVIALSPSAGFFTPHPVGEVGRVAATPEPVQR